MDLAGAVASGFLLAGCGGNPPTDGGDRGERGLLSVAFHPDFATNGRSFFDYTDSVGELYVSSRATARSTDSGPREVDVVHYVWRVRHMWIPTR